MPAREKRKAPETTQHPQHSPAEVNTSAAKGRVGRFYPPGNSTRINAFVSAQGRRNQAKRDAK